MSTSVDFCVYHFHGPLEIFPVVFCLFYRIEVFWQLLHYAIHLMVCIVVVLTIKKEKRKYQKTT